jgi:hypothetical protein
MCFSGCLQDPALPTQYVRRDDFDVSKKARQATVHYSAKLCYLSIDSTEQLQE